ncbi:MAG TPA: OmpA family protein [Verrucomicrobiae bacterium]|jgi:outer membrane protein OmpA-like peptidoglycan-associated protein
MKIHTLFAVGLGTLLVAMTGCKNQPIRTTSLPGYNNGSTTAGSATDLTALPVRDKADINSTPGGAANGDLPDDATLEGREQDRTTFAAQTVYFEYDQSNVKADEAAKIDQVVAAFRNKGPSFDLLIEGHCDERGTEEYNRSLGERRALAIRELLTKSGVESAHVFTRTFGKDRPASPGHDEASRAKNRRGEFVLVLPRKIITTQNTQ